MHITLRLLCVVLAFVFFLLAGLNVPSNGKLNDSLGFAALTLAYLLG